jgi:hypothetical protein
MSFSHQSQLTHHSKIFNISTIERIENTHTKTDSLKELIKNLDQIRNETNTYLQNVINGNKILSEVYTQKNKKTDEDDIEEDDA